MLGSCIETPAAYMEKNILPYIPIFLIIPVFKKALLNLMWNFEMAVVVRLAILFMIINGILGKYSDIQNDNNLTTC